MEYISSTENNLIKKIKKLKIKKYRDEEKLFIAEGWKFLDFDYKPEIIIIREGSDYDLSRFSCRKIMVNDKVFNSITTQKNSQGVIIIYPFYKHKEIKGRDIVILDDIQDPGNLGTIIRVCASSGIKDIILTKNSCDIYNEKVVRSTMGSILAMNIVYLDKSEILKFIEENGYKMIITTLANNSLPYTEMKLDEKNAIVFGNEGHGVSDIFTAYSDENIIIPIYGVAESLNVAVSCGIIVYKLREIREKV